MIVRISFHTEAKISQQQAIYDQIANLTVRLFGSFQPVSTTVDSLVKSSFGVLLNLHEVTQYNKYTAVLVDI